MKKNKKKVIAYVHSHWDREWYRPFEEFRLRLVEVFDKVLKELANGNLESFYFDGQTAALEDYLELFPEKVLEVKELIGQKKLFIGPFYCSSDSFLTSGESFIRNLYFGIKKSKEFGCDNFIGYLSDTFGHSASVPRILTSFGIDKAMMWRGLGDWKSELNWDGVQVTNLIQGYFQDFLSMDCSLEKKAEFLKKYVEKIEKRSVEVILLPIGADHLSIPDKLSQQIGELNKILDDYEIVLKTPFEYFEEVKKQARQEVGGEFLDNSLTFILPGVYSSRIYLKKENAKAQWSLSRISEPLQALGSFVYGCESRQNQVDYAYKQLIKNHAHDSIYGCSVDEVHKEMMTRFLRVSQVSSGVQKRVVRDLSDSTENLAILNLSNYPYSGLVRVKTHKKLGKKYKAQLVSKTKAFTDEKLYNIGQIPVTEDYTDIYEYLVNVKNIPAFSHKCLLEEDIESNPQVTVTENSAENEYVKFEVFEDKVCLTDKTSNKIYKDFINIIDRADIGDSYNFGPLARDKKLSAVLKSFDFISLGNLQAKISLKYEIDIPASSTQKGRAAKTYKHALGFDIFLNDKSKNIEFELSWVNKSLNHILQVEFDLKDPVLMTVNEDMFGLVNRTFDPNFDIYKKIPAPRGIEIKPNTAPIQRFVWAQGIGFITEGLTEYEVFKNTLSLTLLRATGVISNPKNPSRGTPAGPPLPTPELQCLGENKSRFAICFEKEPENLYKQAEEFYGTIIPIFSSQKSKELFNINNPKILVYAIKTSGKYLVLRLVNISNEPQKAILTPGFEVEKIYQTTPLEEKFEQINSKNLVFAPNEIKTIAIDK